MSKYFEREKNEIANGHKKKYEKKDKVKWKDLKAPSIRPFLIDGPVTWGVRQRFSTQMDYLRVKEIETEKNKKGEGGDLQTRRKAFTFYLRTGSKKILDKKK